jgi:hypothetical protein
MVKISISELDGYKKSDTHPTLVETPTFPNTPTLILVGPFLNKWIKFSSGGYSSLPFSNTTIPIQVGSVSIN